MAGGTEDMAGRATGMIAGRAKEMIAGRAKEMAGHCCWLEVSQ